ncbi:MAG: hypothetical protein KDA22_10395 [Phycisphaerales bacterium]|nr:hypothetical protein [Phycisphaerales bacterium]
MPNTTKSPYTTSFCNAINRGTPCWTAICNIANRNGTTPNVVGNSLCKAGCCCRQKFNGQWIFFPTFSGKWNATQGKKCHTNMWQSFVDFCMCSGICTPKQMLNCCGSQAGFVKGCRPFWTKACSTPTPSSNFKKGSKKATGRNTGWTYAFPGNSKSSSGKFRKVA